MSRKKFTNVVMERRTWGWTSGFLVKRLIGTYNDTLQAGEMYRVVKTAKGCCYEWLFKFEESGDTWWSSNEFELVTG